VRNEELLRLFSLYTRSRDKTRPNIGSTISGQQLQDISY